MASALVLAGCAGGGSPGPVQGTLQAAAADLFLTDEVELTLALDRPAGPSGLTVPITSSNALILTTPNSVRFNEGEREKTFSAVGVTAGGPVVVSARVGPSGPYPSVEVTVLPPPTIALAAVVTSADQFSTGNLAYTGTASHVRALDPGAATMTPPSGLGLTLGSPVLNGDEDAFTLEVPYQLAVDAPPGTYSIQVDTNGADIGGKAAVDFTVVRIPRVTALDPAAATLDATEIRSFQVVLDLPARAGGETVAMSSQDDVQIGVPQSVAVPAGELAASFDVEGLATTAGSLDIDATLADSQAISSVTVRDAIIGIDGVTGNEGYQGSTGVSLAVTGTGSSYVAVDTNAFTFTAPAGSGITLSNVQLAGDAAAWTLTADVSVDAAAATGTVMLPFDANGAVPGAGAVVPFLILEPPQVLSVGPDGTTIEIGVSGSLEVALTSPARAGGEMVSLVSSSASIAVPASVTVVEGQTTAMFQVDGISEGFSIVTASLNGGSDDTLVEAAFAEIGGVVVTEMTVMTTDTSGSNVGERIELLNASGGTLEINGWYLETLTSGPLTFRSAVTPTDATFALSFTNGALVFGVPNPADAADIPPDAAFVYGDPGTAAAMDDAGDRLRIFEDASTLHDQVDFTTFVSDGAAPLGASDYPGSPLRSTQLDPSKANSYDNDDGGNWCTSFRAADTHGLPNQSCSGTVVINEVLYDADGGDASKTFVELAGPGGSFLGSMMVRPIKEDGTFESQTNAKDVLIPVATRMPADGFYVIADTLADGVTTQVANYDQLAERIDPENGPGDAIQLVDAAGNYRDVVMYGANPTGLTMAEDGTPIVEGTNAPAVSTGGHSINRDANSTDSDENSADFFVRSAPTPGAQNP